ncbi:MAG: hypothetical protein NW703_11935 [Nitrospiraceae bacterium]
MRFLAGTIPVLIIAQIAPGLAAMDSSPPIPRQVQAFDTPSDGGGRITVLWAPSPGEGPDLHYQVLLQEGPPPADPAKMRVIAEFPSDTHHVYDANQPWWTRHDGAGSHLYQISGGKGVEIKNGMPYSIAVASVQGGQRAFAPPVRAIASPNWFNWNALNNLIIALSFGLLVLFAIRRAHRKPIFLRYIPGLDAVDEAIGRATELGKPVMYLTGAHDMSDPSTVAAAVILGRVATRTAAYETDLMVPHRNPITMAVCQEITRQAYFEAGKPDLFREDANFFITADQFSYTASVDGIMLRTKPAANFFMGAYFAEALLLTETGASTGAIQIAGTDSDHQLPFFVTTCDYTLIGEELYAASAYLSREPVQVGTLLGQDIGKLTVLSLIAIGSIAATLKLGFGVEWAYLLLDALRDVK